MLDLEILKNPWKVLKFELGIIGTYIHTLGKHECVHINTVQTYVQPSK
jgi:hypothetical protein